MIQKGLSSAGDSVQAGSKHADSMAQDYKSKAASNANRATEQVGNAAGSAWNEVEKGEDAGKNAYNSAVSSGKNAWGGMKDKIDGGYASSKDEASKFVGTASDKVQGTVESSSDPFKKQYECTSDYVKSKYEDASNTGKDKFGTIVDTAKDAHNDKSGSVKDTAGHVGSLAEGNAHDLKDTLMNVKESAMGKVHNLAENLRGKSEPSAHDNPASGTSQMMDMYRGATQKISNFASGISNSMKGGANSAAGEVESASHSASGQAGKLTDSVQEHLHDNQVNQAAVGGSQGGIPGPADKSSLNTTTSIKQPSADDGAYAPDAGEAGARPPTVADNHGVPGDRTSGDGGVEDDRALYVDRYDEQLRGTHGNALSSAHQYTLTQYKYNRYNTGEYTRMRDLGRELEEESRSVSQNKDSYIGPIIGTSQNAAQASADQHMQNMERYTSTRPKVSRRPPPAAIA